ncbi:MAG: Nudix family hydrolase [Methylococcales bacterium]|nr:Nudix family hydrolase [Methylococcales bacterium]
MSINKPVHVAVGVIKNNQGHVLISFRHKSSHQGGLWEFPGGKIEPKETVEQALARELKEELGIFVEASIPLIKIRHQYTDLEVLLDVREVTLFSGNPSGIEGQEVNWVDPDQLSNYKFPEANYPIITAARLPNEYAILNGADIENLLKDLNLILNKGGKLIQARVKALSGKEVITFFKQAIPLCEKNRACLLVNSAVKNADIVGVSGIHLTAMDLLALKQKPTGYIWVSASCHNLQELQYAEKIGVDFVVLAPVLPTKTHIDAKPLGWECFKEIVSQVNLPVFALGGMKKGDKRAAQEFGAQGIAGITTFLKS